MAKQSVDGNYQEWEWTNKGNEFRWPDWMPKQEEFILSQAKYPMLSGGWGSGKSWALCMRVLLFSTDSNVFGDLVGNRGILGRSELSELKKTTLKDMMELLPYQWIQRFNKQDMTIVLKAGSGRPVGSEIVCSPLKDFRVGGNFSYVAIDQAEEIEQEILTRLSGRIRMDQTIYKKPIPAFVRSVFGAMNPNGHSWQYKLWELNRKAKERGRPYNPEYHLQNITTYENQQNLPPDYISNLETSLTKKQLRIFVGGSWEAFEGMVYDEWNEILCVAEKNLVPGSDWRRVVGLDWGYPKAKVAMFLAQDPYSKDLLLYDEVVMEDATTETFLQAVLARMVAHERESAEQEDREMEPFERISCWPYDPSMGRPLAENADLTLIRHHEQTAMRLGFVINSFRANNSIEAGNDLVNWLFQNCQPAREHLPKIHVNPRCHVSIDAFESYCLDPKTGKPKADQFDHPCDALRYAATTLIPNFNIRKKRSRYRTNVADVISDIKNMRSPGDLRVYGQEQGWGNIWKEGESVWSN